MAKTSLVEQTRTTVAARAKEELNAAQRALLQANALFSVLQFGVGEGRDCPFDLFALTQIGEELTATYAARADGEAAFFHEVNHG